MKNKNFKWTLLIGLLVATTVFAAKFSENFLIIGKGLVSEETKIISNQPGSNDPFIKYDPVQGAWFSSNDGIIEQRFGTGGGNGSGGINEISNPGFEDGIANNWANTGGTYSELTAAADVSLGEKSARFVSIVAGEYLESDNTPFSNLVQDGFGCMADFYYKGGANFDVKIFKEDLPTNPGTFIEVATETVVDQTVWTQFPTINFPCAESMKIRFESTAGGTIDVDQVYLGSNKGFTQTAEQPRFVGAIRWQQTANCQWNNNTTSFGSFVSDNDCDDNPRELIGEALDSSSGLQPKLGFAFLPKGRYTIKVSGYLSKHTSANTVNRFRVETNGIGSSVSVFASNNGENGAGDIELTIDFTEDQSNVVFDLQAQNGGGNNTIIFGNAAPFEMSAYYWPSTTETTRAFTPRQAEFYYEGYVTNTSGNASIATVGAFTYPSLSSLELVNEIGSGQIGCVSAPSNGTTCSGTSEQLALVLDIPVAGKYKYCASGVVFSESEGQGTLTLSHLTNDGNDTLIERKVETVYSNDSASGNGIGFPYRLCHVFEFDSPGAKKVSITARETTGAFFLTASQVPTNGSAGVFKWDVTLINHNVSRPILQDMVSTKNSRWVLQSCEVQGGASPVPQDDCTPWVDIVTRELAGRVSFQFSTGFDTSKARCWCNEQRTVAGPTYGGSDSYCKVSFNNSTGRYYADIIDGTNNVDSNNITLFCRFKE